MSRRPVWQTIMLSIVVVLIATSMSACGEVDATWKVVKITSKAEKANYHVETIDVRSCSEVEKKTCGCSASSGQSLSLKAQPGVSVGLDLVVDAHVDLKVEFGFTSSRELGSSETLALDPAPRGRVFRYRVRKTYRTFTGKATVRSPLGEEREVEYSFEASCTQSFEAKEVLSCAEADTPRSEASAKVEPAKQDLKSAIIGAWNWDLLPYVNFEFTADGKEIVSSLLIPNSTYKWLDEGHIEENSLSWPQGPWTYEVKIDGDSMFLKRDSFNPIHMTRVK